MVGCTWPHPEVSIGHGLTLMFEQKTASFPNGGSGSSRLSLVTQVSLYELSAHCVPDLSLGHSP